MKPDYIVRMAKNDYGIYAFTEKSLEEFIALIAAAERETCARMCEEIEEPSFQLQEPNLKFRYEYRRAVLNCAAAIRARGDQ